MCQQDRRRQGMTSEEAEKVLAQLEPAELQKVISRLANKTPDIAYYPATFMNSIMESEAEAGERSMAMRSMLVLTYAMKDHIGPGDNAELSLRGVYHGDVPAGNWHIKITRLPDQIN
jgi:hypothetical protein